MASLLQAAVLYDPHLHCYVRKGWYSALLAGRAVTPTSCRAPLVVDLLNHSQHGDARSMHLMELKREVVRAVMLQKASDATTDTRQDRIHASASSSSSMQEFESAVGRWAALIHLRLDAWDLVEEEEDGERELGTRVCGESNSGCPDGSVAIRGAVLRRSPSGSSHANNSTSKATLSRPAVLPSKGAVLVMLFHPDAASGAVGVGVEGAEQEEQHGEAVPHAAPQQQQQNMVISEDDAQFSRWLEAKGSCIAAWGTQWKENFAPMDCNGNGAAAVVEDSDSDGSTTSEDDDKDEGNVGCGTYTRKQQEVGEDGQRARILAAIEARRTARQ